MKHKLIYFFIIILLLFLIYIFRNTVKNLFFASKEKQTIESIIKKYNTQVFKSLNNNFTETEINPSSYEVAILAFKKEQILEVYVRKTVNSNWKFLKKYSFTAFSGNIGPKLNNGDRQIPEGIYKMEYLNPNSLYHLSIKVSYPNSFDKEKAGKDGRLDLGGDIMIHGKNVTIGCIPIGDKNIEELFILAAKANNKNFPIIIAPQDFRVNRSFPKVDSIDWENELYTNIENELKKY